jgi:hypothetical protein
MPLQP